MSIPIGGADSARWGTHIAKVHLRRDCQRLTADVVAEADERVIAADRAAVIESSREVSSRRNGRLDVLA